MIDEAMMRRLMTQCGMENYIIDDAAMRLGKAIYEAGAKEEREACATIVAGAAPGFCGGRAETVLYTIAASIRDRSNAEVRGD